MYLLITDETNRENSSSNFFLMGGIAIPFQSSYEINTKIQEIRKEHGYSAKDSLKYSRSSKPKELTNERFNSAKHSILRLCDEYDIKIFLYVCHHLIAKNKKPIEKFQYGSNGLLWNANQFLSSANSSAWVLQDRHPVDGEFNYYKQRFMESQPDYDNHYHKLNRIIGFGSTCDGASNLASIADICLGSYRFCINHPDKDKDKVNGLLMPTLLRNTWGYPDCIGKGIGIYPNGEVRKKECKPHYENLLLQIEKYLKTEENK